MGISGPNVNANKDDGIIIKDRRQLLVKVGSFMKSSWRRSTDKITDLMDDKDNKNSNDDDDDDDINNNRRRRRKHNFFVQFDDEVYVIPTSRSSCSFDTFISTRNNNTRNNERQETQVQIQTQPMSETEPKEEQEQEEEIPSSSSWYQSDDYCRFKKDMILNSLNYINAKRASKVFDEEKYSIRGIRHMCSHASGDPNYRRRQTSEKKYLYKVIREEQNKQQQKQNCASSSSTKNPYTKYDMDKFRFVSVTQTKNGRDRAISLGNEYAREQRQQQQKDEQQQQHQRNNNNNNNNTNTNTNNRGGGGFTSSPSMKNLISLGRQIQNNKVKRTDD